MVDGLLAPCMRHTGDPNAQRFQHCRPDLFDLARHRATTLFSTFGSGNLKPLHFFRGIVVSS